VTARGLARHPEGGRLHRNRWPVCVGISGQNGSESLAALPRNTHTRRLYREEGLQLRRKTPKRKVSAKRREDRVVAAAANDCWSMDFLSDQLFDGRKIRVLTIVDNFTRVSPAIDVRTSYRGADVVATLERVAQAYGPAEADTRGQWAGVHLEGPRPLGLAAWRRARLLTTGQADGQRLRGVVQWQVPRRVFEHILVPQPGRRQAEM